MTKGMVREVDQVIGGLSTLVISVGLLVVRSMDFNAVEMGVSMGGMFVIQLREVYRSIRDHQSKWERCDLDGGGKDVYYQCVEQGRGLDGQII